MQSTVSIFFLLNAVCAIGVCWKFDNQSQPTGTRRNAHNPFAPLCALVRVGVQVKAIVGELLDSKAAQWAECRALCAGRLKELAEYFTGQKALTRVKKDERMMKWFASLAAEVRTLYPFNSKPLNLWCIAGRSSFGERPRLHNTRTLQQTHTQTQPSEPSNVDSSRERFDWN